MSIVLAAFLLACCAVAWLASSTRANLEEARARVEEAVVAPATTLPQVAKGWISGASFAFDLEPPSAALREWMNAMRLARTEQLPAPPSELVDWLQAHASELNALRQDVQATGPLELPRYDRRTIGRHDFKHPYVAAWRAQRLFIAAAGVAAWEDKPDDASARLEAAWTLQVSTARAHGGGVGGDLLGALRVIRSADARAWNDRLASMDERSACGVRLSFQARNALWELDELAQYYERDGLPEWLPKPMRQVALRVVIIPREWGADNHARGALDARAALLAQERCTDPADLIEPAWDTPLRDRESGSELRLMKWVPVTRRARSGYALAHASDEMGDLNLTRQVLAIRAGIAGDRATCWGPPVHVEPTEDGRLTVLADTPGYEAAASFTLTPPWIEGSSARAIAVAR